MTASPGGGDVTLQDYNDSIRAPRLNDLTLPSVKGGLSRAGELRAAALRAGLDNLLESGDVAIVDSGAGGHFLGNKQELTRLRAVSRHMHTASGTVPLDTAGDLELRVEDAQGNSLEPLVLRDASVMKHSPLNLVSVGVLCNEGSIFHW